MVVIIDTVDARTEDKRRSTRMSVSPSQLREGKAPLTQPSAKVKQKEYTRGFLRVGEAALAVLDQAGRRGLLDLGLACQKRVSVTRIMQPNRPSTPIFS